MKTIASITALTLLFTAIPATAQNIPLCYMQTKKGLLLDLEKLCDRKDQKFTKPLSADEQKFLEDVQQSMKGYPEAQAAIDPQVAISQAKRICNELEAGTFSDYQQAQAETLTNNSDPTSQLISSSQSRAIQTIAPKYFCPAFDG